MSHSGNAFAYEMDTPVEQFATAVLSPNPEWCVASVYLATRILDLGFPRLILFKVKVIRVNFFDAVGLCGADADVVADHQL